MEECTGRAKEEAGRDIQPPAKQESKIFKGPGGNRIYTETTWALREGDPTIIRVTWTEDCQTEL